MQVCCELTCAGVLNQMVRNQTQLMFSQEDHCSHACCKLYAVSFSLFVFVSSLFTLYLLQLSTICFQNFKKCSLFLGVCPGLQLRDSPAPPPVSLMSHSGIELQVCPVLQMKIMLGAVSVVTTGLSQCSQGTHNTLTQLNVNTGPFCYIL